MTVYAVTKNTGIKMNHIEYSSNRIPPKARIPEILKSLPPSLCVLFHTLSLLKVHGVLMPINQFLFAFSTKIPQ